MTREQLDCPVKRCGAQVLRGALSIHLMLRHRYRPRQIARAWDLVHGREAFAAEETYVTKSQPKEKV